MAASLELRAEAQDSLAFGSIVAGYTQIGTPFAHPIRIMMVQNLTDVLLQFSFDGSVDHFVLPAGGQMIIDATANQLSNVAGFFLSVGTKLSVKRIGTPSSGAVYLSTFYARGS